jgi:hypothetical protein
MVAYLSSKLLIMLTVRGFCSLCTFSFWYRCVKVCFRLSLCGDIAFGAISRSRQFSHSLIAARSLPLPVFDTRSRSLSQGKRGSASCVPDVFVMRVLRAGFLFAADRLSRCLRRVGGQLPGGVSSRRSAWCAKRPRSRGCTLSCRDQGQPPNWVRR